MPTVGVAFDLPKGHEQSIGSSHGGGGLHDVAGEEDVGRAIDPGKDPVSNGAEKLPTVPRAIGQGQGGVGPQEIWRL